MISPSVGDEREVDPRPALRAQIEFVGRGEDRSDQIRGEDAGEFVSTRRAHYGQSQSLPVSGCSHVPIPESRSSGGDPV